MTFPLYCSPLRSTFSFDLLRIVPVKSLAMPAIEILLNEEKWKNILPFYISLLSLSEVFVMPTKEKSSLLT